MRAKMIIKVKRRFRKKLLAISIVILHLNLPQSSSIFFINPSGKSLAESSKAWPSTYSFTFLIRFSLAAWSCPDGAFVEIFLLIVCNTSRYLSTCFSTCCNSSLRSGFVDDLREKSFNNYKRSSWLNLHVYGNMMMRRLNLCEKINPTIHVFLTICVHGISLL